MEHSKIKRKKIFIHIGAPKSASTFLQYNFHNNKKLNFLGIIRDHENIRSKPKYDDSFHLYCRHIKNSLKNALKIKKKISKDKINIISDEGFIVSEYANFKKIINRIIKIFPNCEFILVLRHPVDTILSWQNFHLRGIKDTPLNIKSYLKKENTRNVIDLVNYKNRINYIKNLKKNRLHIINFDAIKNGRSDEIFNAIFGITNFYGNNISSRRKHNISIYLIKNLYIKFPILRKLKFYLPRVLIIFLKNLLYKSNLISKIKKKNDDYEVRFLGNLFAKEILYYKSLFKTKDYFTIN